MHAFNDYELVARKKKVQTLKMGLLAVFCLAEKLGKL